jgi:hypothetical protein
VVHLQAAERVLQYVCGTYDQGIAYCDLGAEVKNKLIGWVDSDFGSDPDTRKSITGYLMVVYLREHLKGFSHPQMKPTEKWEDNASCIMMSENPTNRDRSRHVDVKVHYLGTTCFRGTQGTMWRTRVPFSSFFSTVETKVNYFYVTVFFMKEKELNLNKEKEERLRPLPDLTNKHAMLCVKTPI